MSNQAPVKTDQITLSWQDGLHMQVNTPNFDAPILLDADPEVGGQDKGHRPLQMLLVGLAGCMAMDTVSILKKKRQEFTHFEITFPEVVQREDHPHGYTHIKMHVTAGGPKISEEALARALQLSYEKYCPANAMLRAYAEIEYSYEIVTV